MNRIRGYASKGGATGLPKQYHGNCIAMFPAATSEAMGSSDATVQRGALCYFPALIRTCIEAGCHPGGVVLDPFMGAGKTAVVAKELSRNYAGIELNEMYVKWRRKE